MTTKNKAVKKHRISKNDFDYHVKEYNEKELAQGALAALIRFTNSLETLMYKLRPLIETSHRRVMAQRKHHLKRIQQYKKQK